LALQAAGLAHTTRGKSRWLAAECSLALVHGRLTALLGPNGAGKTTLLRLLAGLWTPTTGRATLGGRDLRTIPPRELARRVAWLGQESQVAFDFSVAEVVGMGRFPHESRFGPARPADDAAIGRAMQQADVVHLAERLATELSEGERQRVLLARCLATEADILLLDEPTSHLDLAHALSFMALCRELAHAGRAVAVSVHDLNLSLQFADEAITMSEGRIRASGPPERVLTPEHIRAVFGVEAALAQGPAGETGLVFRTK
jgi:iron complex transport system ATP-binding protein